MENGKGQTIFLSVIGVVTLLVAIVGATFAWFSVEITGNNSAESVYVETMKLGSVTYTDSNAITLTNVKPITAAQVTNANKKTFTVAQTANDATETLTYTVRLEVIEGQLATVDDGHFVHTLSATKTGSGTTATVAKTEVPNVSTDLGTGTLVGFDSHTYTYTIYLEEANEPQNEAQGAKFSGKIQVSLSQTNYGGAQ